MKRQDNWHDFLNHLLTSKGQFILVDSQKKGDATIDYYRQQINDKETVVKLGLLKNGRLTTLTITNPKTPGHNAEQLEYFYENDFDSSKKIGLFSVGLPYSDINQEAINSILKLGLKGTEKKYFIDNKLQFSKIVRPIGDKAELIETTHHFVTKSFWLRQLLRLLKPKRHYTIDEVELNKIFAGLR